jgi:hypothetical protein
MAIWAAQVGSALPPGASRDAQGDHAGKRMRDVGARDENHICLT